MNYKNFFWTICSGSLEKIYEEHGGIKVPTEYLPAFKMFIDYEIIPNDEYHIMVKLNDGEIYQKTVYGFNSKDALDIAIAERDQRVLDRINRINRINESSSKYHVDYSAAEKAMSIVNIFYEERCNGLEDLSQTLYDILIDNKNIIEQHLENYVFTDSNERDRYMVALENANDILDSSTLIKIHKG